jgi:phage terminase large subunit
VEVANRVISAIESEKPDAIVVDGDGLGAGVVDQLRHRNFGTGLFEFHGGARAFDSDAYYNRRCEIWSLMAAWLKAGAAIPDDPELAADLVGPMYGFSAKNQLQLEKKDDCRSRGIASPDIADALAMTFAVKVAPRSQPEPPRQEWYGATDAGLAWMS